MSFLSLLFPALCPYCGKPVKGSRTECERCEDNFPNSCLYRTLETGESCTAPFPYHGQARDAILDLKFRSRRFNARSLGKCMAQAVRQQYDLSEISAVTFVPMLHKQKRMRGYNQAELLAREAAGWLNKPCVGLLKKVRSNRIQHELSREERIRNVEEVYALALPKPLVHCTILLVDDICTTGSTLSACSKVLLRGGASSVVCVTAAFSDSSYFNS